MFNLLEIKRFWAKNQFTVRDRVMLYQEMQMGIEDGVSIPDIINDINDTFYRQKSPLKIMTNEWLIRTASGKSLSDSVIGWLPESDVFLISAGEQKDGLYDTFSELIRMTEEQEELMSSIKKKVSPQVVMFFALSAAIYGFSLKLAPGFKDILDESQWPEVARMYFQFTDWYVDAGPYIISTALLTLILSFSTFKVLTGPIRVKLDKIPPWSIYRKIKSAQFLIVASGMIKSGIAMKDILSNMTKHANPYIKSRLREINHRLARGMNEGEALRIGFLDEEIEYKVLSYSKRSSFHKGILALGHRTSKEMVRAIEEQADKIGSYINYSIYLFIGFTMVALSEMVSTTISNVM